MQRPRDFFAACREELLCEKRVVGFLSLKLHDDGDFSMS